MATASTTQRRINTLQVVSTHPTLSTVQTLRDQLQALILTRAVQQNKAVGHLDSHILNTNIITILAHTVKGVLGILDHTLTTVKVVMQCLQIPPTLLVSLFTRAPRVMDGRTLVRMPPLHSSSGNQASSLHKTTMGTLYAQLTLQHGLGLGVGPHHLISPRTNSTSVLHQWGPNPDHPLPQINLTESLLK